VFAFRLYALQEIISVEHVPDPLKGDRFLLELRLTEKQTERSILLSEHVYRPLPTDSKLCYPGGFQWSKSSTVNIIVPVKNSGRWALYFIKNIAGKSVKPLSYDLPHRRCSSLFSVRSLLLAIQINLNLAIAIHPPYCFIIKYLMSN